jgi:hypothetical protein
MTNMVTVMASTKRSPMSYSMVEMRTTTTMRATETSMAA